jgi:GNAT superfamily N-acetyltransferase
VPLTSAVAGRGAVAEIVAALAAWTPPTWTGQLHPGDVGWELRFEDDHVDSSFLVVRDSGSVVAAGLVDEPQALRVAVDPTLATDAGLGAFLADAADDLLAAGEAYVDGLPLAAWRAVLADRDWDADPDPWVALHRSLATVGSSLPTGVAPVSGARDVADRVAVQRAAFERSTFTEARWARMAAGPIYDGALDLLARDADGRPVSAGTAWSAGRGRCGLLEPVGTHRDHQRQGHGRRLLDGLCVQLAAAGASSVAVATPAANTGAVAAYVAAGFRVLGLLTAMRRPAR